MNNKFSIIKLLTLRSVLALAIGFISLADACPTCVGRVHKAAPAFFAEEIQEAEEAKQEDETEKLEITQEADNA
ncbi:MAG: hypothetical protein NTX86_00470 [Candidatus Dependentiae bacterium]|nr:hypothetical protein [Candidatus Dependentiae bacterium]